MWCGTEKHIRWALLRRTASHRSPQRPPVCLAQKKGEPHDTQEYRVVAGRVSHVPLRSGECSAGSEEGIRNSDLGRLRPGNVQRLLRGLSWQSWKRRWAGCSCSEKESRQSDGVDSAQWRQVPGVASLRNN